MPRARRGKRVQSDDSQASQVERDPSEANRSLDAEDTENCDPQPRGVDATTKRRSPLNDLPQVLREVQLGSGSDESSAQSGLWPKAKRSGARSQGEKVQPDQSKKRGSNSHDSLDSLNSTDPSVALYDAILNKRLALAELVGIWVAKYKKDKDQALLSLQQLFVSSSGCTGVLTPETRELEHAELIRRLSPKFDYETGDYPLIMLGQKWQSFRKDLGEFVELLIDRCRNSIIYDQELLADVTTFLIGLSDSQIRAFRHTSTFAALKLGTALVKVAFTVSQNLRNARRQLAQEKRRSRSSGRIEALAAKVEEIRENLTELAETLNALYSSVFVHRYIDVACDIRSLCVVEMGRWMEILPEIYVNDKYLKYIGWNLSDKSPEVRFECLQSLMPLYEASERLKPKLEGFTVAFKPRIVAMVLDEDSEVAAEAVKLVTRILVDFSKFLTDADCERVFELVYSSHRGVALAAGVFLRERLFKPDESVSPARSKRGKPRHASAPLVRDLVLFFVEAELREHAAYLVDALIDASPMVKDWDCMADLLLEDAGPEEETLSDEAESCLIDIMLCSVRQAATGEIPVGRTSPRNIAARVDRKRMEADRRRLTELLIPALPPLLAKYGADPAKVANLLQIPRYFDLSMYATLREEPRLDDLLRGIAVLVANKIDADFLEVAAKTLEIFCADGSPIAASCEVSRSLLVDALVDCYRRATIARRIAIGRDDAAGDEATFAVVQSLKKIAIFYCSHDLNESTSSTTIRKALFLELEDARDPANDFPAEAVVYCIAAYRQSLLWGRRRLADPQEGDSRTQLKLAARELRQDLVVFLEAIGRFVAGGGNEEARSMTSRWRMAIREEAYGTICDLLVVFSARLPDDASELLSGLVYPVDEHLQGILSRFLQERVFREDEDAERDEEARIEELHKRRNLLAGYCKLVVYDILPARCAADVFKHYAKFYTDHGDIIKQTFLQARSINGVNCALSMLLSLKQLFLEILAARREVRREFVEFKAIKELARKFAPLLGSRAAPNREAVVAVHRVGISFAVDAADSSPSETPANLLFFEVLDEFSKKLVEEDKRVVLDHLNSSVHALVPSTPGKEWKPLLVYRSSLMQGAGRIASRVAEDKPENLDTEQSDREAESKTKKRVAKKSPLRVTKVTFAGGSRASVRENDDLSSTPDSPLPMIQDSSENSNQGANDGIGATLRQSETAEAQPHEVRRSSRKRSSPVLYEDEY